MKHTGLLLSIIVITTGCNSKSTSPIGEDKVFLQAPEPESPKNTQSLLPLQQGNVWEMQAKGNQKYHKDIITVNSLVNINNKQGYLLRLDRDGKLWRQEVYQNNEQGLFLLAFGEKKRDLLILSPPFPVAKNPVNTGNHATWMGKIKFGNQSFDAKGFTRVTCIETVQTNMGRFQCYRLDSVITMINPNKKDLHFPTIRWVSENTGFIQRSFADDGRPAIQILEKFKKGNPNAKIH